MPTDLLLSDSFPVGAPYDIEVHVRMIDIGPGEAAEIKSACKPLGEYSWLVERIRDGVLAGWGMMEAIDRAIEEIPEDFLIGPYLLAHMLLTEYNEEEAMQLFREEGREEATVSLLANVMRNLGVTATQAMEILGVPASDRKRYLSML